MRMTAELRQISHREKEGKCSWTQMKGGGSAMWVWGLSPEFGRDCLVFP